MDFTYNISTYFNVIPAHNAIQQAPVVQKLDSAIHRINHYPMDKYLNRETNCAICPLDSAIHLFEQLEPDKSLSSG